MLPVAGVRTSFSSDNATSCRQKSHQVRTRSHKSVPETAVAKTAALLVVYFTLVRVMVAYCCTFTMAQEQYRVDGSTDTRQIREARQVEIPVHGQAVMPSTIQSGVIDATTRVGRDY